MQVYDIKLIGYMKLFEDITSVRAKDCYLDKLDNPLFIVPKDMLGRAIGRGSIKLKRLSRLLKKPIKIVEFDTNMQKFVSNLLYPIKAAVECKDKEVYITVDSLNKGRVLGRDRSNLKLIQQIVSKYFDVKLVVR